MLNTLSVSFHLIFTLNEFDVYFYLIVQMRKERLREIHWLAQDHTVTEWPNQGFAQVAWRRASVFSSIPWSECGLSDSLGWLHNVKDSLQFPEWGGPSPDYCSQDFCVQIGLSRRIACLLNVALAKLVPDWVYHIFRWQFSPIVTFTVSQGVNIVLRSLSSNWLWFQILVLPSRYVAMHKWSKLLELQSCICQAKILAPSS